MNYTKTMNRGIIRILIAAIMIIVIAMPTGAFAYATGDDYPYKNGVYGRYNPSYDIDKWNFWVRECTSFAAWCLTSRNGVAFNNSYMGVRWGNASNWGNAAKSVGIPVNMTPAVGSVVWWSGGHVAWVRSVSGDQVLIEEYNVNWNGKYNERWINKNSVSGYIHIKDIGSSNTGNAVTVTPMSGTGTVNTTVNLNVRNGPGTNYGIVGSLAPKSQVTVTGKVNDWYRIKYGSGEYFVSGEWLVVSSTTTTPPAQKTGTVTATIGLNVRSGPGTNYGIVGGLKYGTKVTITGESNGWYKIKYGNGEYWAIKDWIKV